MTCFDVSFMIRVQQLLQTQAGKCHIWGPSLYHLLLSSSSCVIFLLMSTTNILDVYYFIVMFWGI